MTGGAPAPAPGPTPPLHARLVWAGWALVVLAVLLLLFCGGSAALATRFLSGAERGVAEVVSSREDHPGARSRTWTTTFSLAAPDGARLAASWTGERPFAQGETVPVVYRRRPFPQIKPDDRWAVWGWTWVFGGGAFGSASLGGTLALAGVLLRRRGSGAE